jgi:putative DNA primase/helicase
VIFIGCGRNGKGKLTELLDMTFGEYYSSFNTKLITKSRSDANSSDVMILDLMKKRVIIGSEIDKRDKLNTGYIKMLTGRDKIKARYNHSNEMIEYQVDYKMILLCNRVPDADEDDEAYRKRLKCIGFPTKFVDNPEKENEKKIDYNLNINELKQYFMILLIKYYHKYEENGLPKNVNIEELTNKITIETNKILEFMNENTEKCDGINVHTQRLYDKFKDWFYQNYPDEKIPSNRYFLQNVKLNYEVCDNIIVHDKKSTGIRNLKLKNYNSEI